MNKRRFAAIAATALVFVGLLFGQTAVQKVRLWDTNLSHSLLLNWNENDTAGRTLNWLVGGADRTITLQGNPTLDDWFNQSVKTTFAPTFTGATLNQGASDDAILAFKSSDVAHGMTDAAETDTFAHFKKTSAAGGGLGITGFTEGTGAFDFGAAYTIGNTEKSSGADAAFNLHNQKKSGTGVGAVGAGENLVAIKTYINGSAWTTEWLAAQGGVTWQSGTSTASRFISTVGTGTAPITTTSTTLCTNLNAGMVDGYHATTFLSPKYIVQEANVDLTAEQSLGALATGILKNTTTVGVGVLSIASGADLPAHDVLSAPHGDTTVAAVTRGAMIAGIGATPKWTAVVAGTEGYIWTMGATEPGWAEATGGAVNFVDLADVPAAYAGAGGYVVKVKADASGLEFVAGGAGVASFNDLDDVPATYVDQAGLFLKVKATEDGLEFVAGSGGAPTDATYIVQTAHGDLSAEQALGALATGILKNTTTTGVLSIAADGTDYLSPVYTDKRVHIRETFDGLSTAAIHGQGAYNDCGAWSSSLVGTTTANVEVKSGADKMLRLHMVAGDGTSTTGCTLSNNWGFISGRVSFKARHSNVGKGACGIRLLQGAGVMAQLYFRTTSKFTFYNGTTATDLTTVPNSNTWYEIDLLITDRFCYISIDGVHQGRFATGAITKITAVDFILTPDAATSADVDIDDLVVINAFGLET